MKKGAFQTSREIFDNTIWNDIPKFRIFFFIVGNAVFSKGGINHAGMKIERGQFLRSYRNLSDDLEYIENRSIKKYSISMINRKISSLVDEERLEKVETELGTLFTVVNYELYQGLDNYKKDNLERTENRDGTGMEQYRNNNKNVKKEKNENIPYAEIMAHLNERSGKRYSHKASGNKKAIEARWNEGNKLEDFIKVINVCCDKWKGVTFSNGKIGDEYLRPSTLFNGKFDERLNWTNDLVPTKPAQPKPYVHDINKGED